MIPLILAGMAAVSIATSATAAYNKSKLNDQNEARNNQKRSDLDTWFNKEYNRDYLGTQEAQSAMRTVTDHYKSQDKKIDGQAAVMGKTDESKLAQKSANADNYSSFVNNLAARGDQYKRSALARYDSRIGAIDNTDNQINQGKQDNWTALSENVSNATSSVASAFAPTGGVTAAAGAGLKAKDIEATKLQGLGAGIADLGKTEKD